MDSGSVTNMVLSQPSSDPERRFEAKIQVWERWGVILILTIYGILQLNNIHHRVFVGQDFGSHQDDTEHLLANPSQWFTKNFTNRPLLYWIGGMCSKIGGQEFAYPCAALVLTMLSLAAFGFVHASSRRFIQSPWFRLAALALIAFLPVTIITAVVYAADSVALLPFALACWALGRALDCEKAKPRMVFAVAAGVAIMVGQLGKFTFSFIPAGVALAVGLCCLTRRLSFRPALAVVGVAGLWPLTAGMATDLAARAATAQTKVANPAMAEDFHFNWHGTGEMTWRSLFLFGRSDGRILEAPTYWDFEYIDGKPRRALLVANNFSYPSLLHLAVFTDVLNFAAGGWNEARTPRPERQQMFSKIAVRTGLAVSILGAAAVICFFFQIARTGEGRERDLPAGLLVWGCLGGSWFLPLVLALPFVNHVYDQGFWLPRLVLPAVWSWVLVLFYFLDRLFGKWTTAARWAVVMVGLQCAVQVASLWY
ncbi:MAG: hypothetical protein ABSE59_05365 [Opitutaceae bacterium]|jgi:hypothetical protein